MGTTTYAAVGGENSGPYSNSLCSADSTPPKKRDEWTTLSIHLGARNAIFGKKEIPAKHFQ